MIDAFREKILHKARVPGSPFMSHKNRLSVRQPQIIFSIQELLLQQMRTTVLLLAYHSTLAGHPGQCWMYDILQYEYYRPNMSSSAFNTFHYCENGTGMNTKLPN